MEDKRWRLRVKVAIAGCTGLYMGTWLCVETSAVMYRQDTGR